MLEGLVSQIASIAATVVVLQRTIAERAVSRQGEMPQGFFDQREIALAMEKALLVWSCDPGRPLDRGLDFRERATLVGMAVDALDAMRRP